MIELTREHLDRHLNPRLRRHVRLYVGISAAIILFIVYRIMIGQGDLWYALAALIIGLVVGVGLSRMYVMDWDTDQAQVISRMDTYGGILLAASIVFELGGEHLIRQWFAGPGVLTMILALAGGAVLGRGLGMGRRMIQTLKQNLF